MASPQKQEIDKAVTDVCVDIIQEPLLYFSEADVQQLLVERLRRIDSCRNPLETSVQRGKGSKGKYLTHLVHREYGGGEGRRLDVVIFDPDDLGKIRDASLTGEEGYLKPLFIFELGTEKTVDTGTHVSSNLEKVRDQLKPGGYGYIIHFFRDTTRSRTRTLSRERTEKKIVEKFRICFSDRAAAPNIKVLAILLRIGRNQPRMRGKCEILDGIRGRWVQVNVSGREIVAEAVMKQLSDRPEEKRAAGELLL